MLRTNSKKYIANIENYLIDAIYTEEHKTEATTDAQKIAFLMSCYDSEFNHKYNAIRYPNEQQRFANWLAGLPSAISIPFYYNDIIELAKQLQEVDVYSEKTEQRICENYFNFMAYHILKLNNKLN
jgi:hypothetical protein